MTKIFNHILVPVDFTDKNRQAVDLALNMVERDSGRVTLLHVIERMAESTMEEFADFYKSLEQRAWKEMKALSVTKRTISLSIDERIQYGNRVDEILRFAREEDVDLIVMSSHRIDVDNPSQGWGTISYKVGILADCPILLVK